MLELALALFALGALGGLILAASVLRSRLAPWALSIAHALLGAAGLIVLCVMLWQGVMSERFLLALGLLVVAALGGFFLASFHLRSKIAPKPVVVLHGTLAIGGFLVLLSLLLQ